MDSQISEKSFYFTLSSPTSDSIFNEKVILGQKGHKISFQHLGLATSHVQETVEINVSPPKLRAMNQILPAAIKLSFIQTFAPFKTTIV